MPHELNSHHILPKSWGGPDSAENRIDLCPNAHASTHVLLNAYVRAGAVPDKGTLAKFSSYTRILAAQAWAQRPNDKPPYTDQHGVIPNA